MLSRFTQRQVDDDTRRFITNAFLRHWSLPRHRALAEKIVGLDLCGALGVVSDLERAVGKRALDKILSQISSHRPAAGRVAIHHKPRQRQKISYANETSKLPRPDCGM